MSESDVSTSGDRSKIIERCECPSWLLLWNGGQAPIAARQPKAHATSVGKRSIGCQQAGNRRGKRTGRRSQSRKFPLHESSPAASNAAAIFMRAEWKILNRA